MRTEEFDEALRADRRWLSALSDALHDAEYARMMHMLATADLPEGFDDEGLTPQVRRAYFGLGDDSVLFKVVSMAAQDLRLSGGTYDSVLLMQTAIPTLNGFCIRAPHSGSPAIVLNHGLPAYASLATHLILGLTGWTDGRYCDHHSAGTFLDGLFRLAEGIRDRTPVPLLDIEAGNCQAPDHPHARLHEMYTVMGELFVVFHEFGHIELGHLDADDVTHGFGAEVGQRAVIFNRSQSNELAADAFAFGQMVRAYVTDGGLMQRDLAYGIGCLFALTRVVEAVSGGSGDTHPPAADRWRAVKGALTEPIVPSAFDSIDYLLDWVDRAEADAGRGSRAGADGDHGGGGSE